MHKITILVISTQYPGYGGASTNAYAIIKYLRKSYQTTGLFIEDNPDIDVDPDKMGNIYRFPLYPFEKNNTNHISQCRNTITNANRNSAPSIILCKNYLAPSLAKCLFPDTKNIYLVSGLPCEFEISNELLQRESTAQSTKELIAIKDSDLVVLNSPISLQKFISFCPKAKNIYPKAVDTTKYIELLIKKTDKNISKKYDFIIASSVLTRREKNNIFLIDILKQPTFDKYTKLIVGNDNAEFREIPNCFVYDLMPHAILMNLMKQTKVLLHPSLFDSNPNTIREAILNKCLILASNNIGYSEIFPSISICQTYDKAEWTKKSIYLAENYDKIIKDYKFDFSKDNVDLLHIINEFVQ